jgi:hypothetical protein
LSVTGITTRQSSVSALSGRGVCRLGLLAAVDPRLSVLSFQRLKIIETRDDAGRPLILPPVQSAPSSFNIPTNYMSQHVDWNDVDPAAKSITLKAELHFTVQLPGEQPTATIDEAAVKDGSLITLGPRRIRLARFSTTDTTLQVQFAPEMPSPSNPTLSFTVTDSTGRTILNAVNRPLESFTSGPISNATGPFRITMRSLDHVRDHNIPFELRNIPLQ